MSTETQPTLPQPEDSPLQKETSLDLINHHIAAARRMLDAPSSLIENQSVTNLDIRTRLTVWSEYSELEDEVIRAIKKRLAEINVQSSEAMQELASENTAYLKHFNIVNNLGNEKYPNLSFHLSQSVGREVRERMREQHLPDTERYSDKFMQGLSMAQVCTNALVRVRSARDKAMAPNGSPSRGLRLITTSVSNWYMTSEGDVNATHLRVGLDQPVLR